MKQSAPRIEAKNSKSSIKNLRPGLCLLAQTHKAGCFTQAPCKSKCIGAYFFKSKAAQINFCAAFFVFRSPARLALALDRGANEGNDTGIQRLKLPTRGFGIGENPRAKDGRGADRWLDTDKEPSIS